MNIEGSLDEFIRDTAPRTLILQGSWGRGKTHLWNARWKKYCDQQSSANLDPRRFAYVSLFGLNSISEVNVAIGLASLESSHTQTTKDEKKPRRNWKWLRAEATKLASELPVDLPYVGFGTNQLAQIFAHSRAKDLLVCLDDIERRGRDLSIRDVLGLVSNLNVQRNCSVIVILNDASLEDSQKEWDANREKVFSRHLSFAPTSEECVSLVFKKDSENPMHRHIRDALIELQLTNIRVADRVKSFAEDVSRIIGDEEFSDSTQRKIARSLSLLTYCHMTQGEGAPSIAFAFSHGAFSSYFRDKDTEVPEQEKAWGKLLDDYHAYLDHPLDKSLSELVLNGHADGKSLTEAINNYEQGSAAEDAKNEYHATWGLWHNAFHNNRDDVVLAFTERFPPAAAHISSNNADATFQLLRSLGANAEADVLIEQWLHHRQGERSKELNPDAMNSFERLRDPGFIARSTEAYAIARRNLPSLEESILKLGLMQGHDEEDIECIAATSPEEIKRFLLNNQGAQLARGVRSIVDLNGHGEIYVKATGNMRAALLSLARDSPYQADRIRRSYGVQQDEPIQGNEE
jgi:hypothetical protein